MDKNETSDFKYIRWAFTDWPSKYNERLQDINNFGEYLVNTKLFKFIIIGEEYAPETGERHFQGYFETYERQRLSTIKRKTGLDTMHLEHAEGSRDSNIRYCSKPNSKEFPEKVIFQYPKSLPRRKKIDWDEYLEDLRTLEFKEIRAKYPERVYHDFSKIMQYRQLEGMTSKMWTGELKHKNYWIWGDPGTGKSYWARSQLAQAEDNNNIYLKQRGKWWDGYRGQNIVLYEDYQPGEDQQISKSLIGYFKIWGDRYTFNAEVKGGSTEINPGMFFLIITSNYSIEECFSTCDPRDVIAIRRRFEEIHIENRNDIFFYTKLDPKILN